MNNPSHSIQVLPQVLAEQIAAGEVVENPSSVVKELVENAIDAQATRIDIVIEDAGFSLMSVSDNGIGMDSTNLTKCVLRHATSKIRSLNDLTSIATMGFRGEALASVGAVSRLTVTSTPDNSGLSNKIQCNGGIAGEIEPCARAKGTTIEVRDLFYNTPARKKFTKTEKAERMALVRCVEQLAIPFPAIHFTLTSDSKTIFDVPAVDTLVQRVGQVAGNEFARNLIPCSGSFDETDVTILISRPQDARARPRYQYLYVNLRRIDSESVLYAIRNAYRDFIMGDYRPAFFCFLTIDPHRVDVNVHPTKQKIKFEDEKRVFGCIHNLIKRQLSETLNPTGDLNSHNREQSSRAGTTGDSLPFPPRKESRPYFSDQTTTQPLEHSSQERPQTVLHFPSVGEPGPQKNIELDSEHTVQLLDTDSDEQWNLISCYQIHNLYILAPIKNGVLLVDQHAAHERILFEQALDRLGEGRGESQQLLFPITIELTSAHKALIESGKEYFEAFGYEVADFGGNTISVSAIPAFLKNAQARGAIEEMLDFLIDEQSMKNFPEPHLRFAAGFACGSAIKAGQELSAEEMNALLNALFAARNPYTCPHGRPTVVRMSMSELRRRFLR